MSRSMSSPQGQSGCLFQVASSQAYWALGKHSGNVCPCYLLPTSNVSLTANTLCPVTLVVDSCVSVHKFRLRPVPSPFPFCDKIAKTERNNVRRTETTPKPSEYGRKHLPKWTVAWKLKFSLYYSVKECKVISH